MFCQGVAKGLLKKEAYRQAGYKSDYGTSDKSSISKRPHIVKRIDELIVEAAGKAQITIDRVVREIGLLAFANPQDFIDENGQPLRIDQLTRDQAATIQDLTVIEQYDKNGKVVGRRYRYKLQDKQTALENLGKHFGLWGPDFSAVINNNTTVINNASIEGDKAVDALLTLFDNIRAARVAVHDPLLPAPKLVEDPIPPPIGSSTKEPMPLQLVVTAPPPSEAKPQTTTEAYFEWASKLSGPP